MNWLPLFVGLTLFFILAYKAGRADIARRIWRHIAGWKKVKFTVPLNIVEATLVNTLHVKDEEEGR